MKFLKEIIRKIVGDPTGVAWKDLDHRKVYAAAAVVVAVLGLIIFVLVSGGKEEGKQEEGPSTLEQSGEVTPENTNPLEEDAYYEVNKVVKEYFHGLVTGDLEMVEESVDILTDEEKQTILKKKDYIEAYHDIICYTKKGLEENTYVVFVSYEMEIYNIDAYAPGIEALYVYVDDAGEYRIYNDEASEELKNYVLELAAEEDAAAVIEDVDARYQQWIAADEEHSKFIQAMLEAQQAQSDKTQETEETEDPEVGDDETEPDDEEEEEPVEEVTAVNKQMQFKETVRIRADRSTESERIGTGYSNELLTVIESYNDGWSKIEYKGKTGYCKTEFLQEPQ